MTPEQTLRRYFGALEKSSYPELCELFEEGAVIHSPLYGVKDAREFYRKLTEDTLSCKVGIRSIFLSVDGPDKAAAHFDYEWTLKDGVPRALELVDLFELNPETGRIKSLKIVFDTHKVRQAFEQKS